MDTHPRLGSRRPVWVFVLAIVAFCALAATALLWLGWRNMEIAMHRDRENEMRRALQSMRGAIEAYHRKHGRYPANLYDLVPNELRAIPKDPVTQDSDWRVTTEQVVTPPSDFSSSPATDAQIVIIDVRSAASGHDTRGKPWSSY